MPWANEGRGTSSNQMTSRLFQSQFLNVDAIIKGCIQKAVIQMEDKKDNSQRPTERIKILYNLLFHTQSTGMCEEKELEVASSCTWYKLCGWKKVTNRLRASCVPQSYDRRRSTQGTEDEVAQGLLHLPASP